MSPGRDRAARSTAQRFEAVLNRLVPRGSRVLVALVSGQWMIAVRS